MKQIQANLIHACTNLHVSVPVIGAAALAIAQIWLPQYAAQLNSTAAILAAYGIIGAANTPSNAQTSTTPKV